MIANLKALGNSVLIQTKHHIDIEDGEYEVEIRECGTRKTNQQLRLMWKFICEIAYKINGNMAERENIYLQCLEMAGARTEVIQCRKDALDGLATFFRHYRIIDEKDNDYIVQVYFGASEMNTKECANLIDTVIRYAEECGINTGDIYER